MKVLEGTFYTYSILEKRGADIKVRVVLNKDHDIFKGHFPGNPVTPGVCQLQIIKEILEDVFDTDLRLTQLKELKFLAMIIPDQYPQVDLQIEVASNETEVSAISKIFSGDVIFTKFKGIFLFA